MNKPGGSVVPGITSLVVLSFLIGVFPYFEGYDTGRRTLFYYFLKSWTDYVGEWKHCVFIPLIVGLLVYFRWPELRRLPVQGEIKWGLGILLLGFFSYWLGYAADLNYLGYASLHLIYAGLILLFLGKQWMQSLLFPFLFLAFMWPMGFLDNFLAFPLRMLMSDSAHHLLNLIGVANVRSGTAILSAPNFSHGLMAGARFAIDVAEPCSGLRSLFALVMVACIYGYVVFGMSPTQATTQTVQTRNRSRWPSGWRLSPLLKVLLVALSSFPLAIVGNIARIIFLTLAGLLWGEPFALGTDTKPSWFHEFAGFAVFIVALGGMVLVVRVLESIPSPQKPEDSLGAQSAPLASSSLVPGWKSGVVVGVAALTLLLCYLTPNPSGKTESGVVMSLPTTVGNWWGTNGSITPAEELSLPKDTELVRKSYTSWEEDQIQCTIVLSGAEKRSIHRPEICLPGQGWTIKNGEVVSVPMHSGTPLRVTQLTLSRMVETPQGRKEITAYYLYWFVGNGVTTPSHLERIWLTTWDRLVHHRNHRWAYVSVIATVTRGLTSSNKGPAETIALLKSFISEAVPSFQKNY